MRALILADTHVWLWWAMDRGRLSSAAEHALAAEDRVCVSAVSCYEVARLFQRGEVKVDRPPGRWMRETLFELAIHVLPITADIAVNAGQLPEHVQRDPCDRLIIATAIDRDVSIVTKDRRIRAFAGVRSVW